MIWPILLTAVGFILLLVLLFGDLVADMTPSERLDFFMESAVVAVIFAMVAGGIIWLCYTLREVP